jgi:hypothetical protein
MLRLLRARELRDALQTTTSAAAAEHGGLTAPAVSSVRTQGLSYLTRTTIWSYIVMLVLVFGRHVYHETMRYRKESQLETQQLLQLKHQLAAASASAARATTTTTTANTTITSRTITTHVL